MATGAPAMLIRESNLERSPVSASDRSEYEASELDAARDPEAERVLLDGIEYPARRPSYDRMLVDDSGRIWVREADGSEVWRVFGDDGVVEGVVTLPEGFDLRGVRENEAFGVQTGGLGYASVRVYAIADG